MIIANTITEYTPTFREGDMLVASRIRKRVNNENKPKINPLVTIDKKRKPNMLKVQAQANNATKPI